MPRAPMSPEDTLWTSVVTSLSTFRVFFPHVVLRGVRRIATGDPLVPKSSGSQLDRLCHQMDWRLSPNPGPLVPRLFMFDSSVKEVSSPLFIGKGEAYGGSCLLSCQPLLFFSEAFLLSHSWQKILSRRPFDFNDLPPPQELAIPLMFCFFFRPLEVPSMRIIVL